MKHTCKKNAVKISAAIELLKEVDPASAEALSDCCNLTEKDLKARIPDASFAGKFRAWLKTQQDELDVVICPAPAHASEILTMNSELPEQSRILIIERDPLLAALLFIEADITSLIRKRRIILSIGESIDDASNKLVGLIDLPKEQGVAFCDINDTGKEWPDYQKMMIEVRDRMRLKLYNMATLIHLGPLWQHNITKNLPSIVSNPGVKALECTFEGKPAIVVAAGPSLNNSLQYIKEYKDQFVIIAVGTALRPLLQAGIRPDLVVSIDASYKIGAQFDKIDCSDLFLVASNIAFPQITDRFKGVFYGYTGGDPIGTWITRISHDTGTIMAGGTVTATAINLAVKMGCNPVICTGLDLCMAETGYTHANNSMYHGVKLPSDQLVAVPGNFRDPVLTTGQFYTYIEIISDYAKSRKDVCFLNATDDGAKLDGMRVIAPSDILDYASISPLTAYDKITALHKTAAPSGNIEKVRKEITSLIDLLSGVKEESLAGASLCNQVMIELKHPLSPHSEIIAKLEEIRVIEQRILDEAVSISFLDMSLRPIYFLLGAKFEVLDDERQKAITANKRSREMFEQIAGSAQWTQALLQEVLEKIGNTNDFDNQLGRKTA